MPVERTFLEDFSINWLRAMPPFQLVDLFDLAKNDLSDGTKPDELERPLLLDLRLIDLSGSDAESVRELVNKRQSLGSGMSHNPVALVAQNPVSFGMLRMYTLYSDVAGLRSEKHTLVTLDIREAADWLYDRLKSPSQDATALLRLIT